MKNLNLPGYNPKVKHVEGKVLIFDVIRKKFVLLTPEEWVRQNFINYLINFLDYPKGLIKIESGLKYNKLLKRSDILIFDNRGMPRLLVECKSYQNKINQKAIDQAAVYNSSLNAEYLLVTNGMQHFAWQKVGKEYKLLQDIPGYETITENPRH